MSDYKGFTAEPNINKLIISVFRLNGALITFGDQLVSDLNLTSSKWQVLGTLSQSAAPLAMPAIAFNMGLSRQGVRTVLKPLIADGLVQLKPNPLHKRSPHVVITSRGAKAYQQAMKRYGPIAQAWEKKITHHDLGQSLKVLASLLEQVNSKIFDRE